MKTNNKRGKPARSPSVQSNKKSRRISSKDRDVSSKHLALCSLQIHYIRHKGTIFQNTELLLRPPIHQQAKSSLTELGITQHNPNRLKMTFHKAFTTPQWRRRWSIFQTIELLIRPPIHQQAKSSLTELGITQHNLNRLKMTFHKAFATLQWRRRWSTDSLSDSHSQHLLTTIIPLRRRLSMVGM